MSLVVHGDLQSNLSGVQLDFMLQYHGAATNQTAERCEWVTPDPDLLLNLWFGPSSAHMPPPLPLTSTSNAAKVIRGRRLQRQWD